jgi:hypothetical protein
MPNWKTNYWVKSSKSEYNLFDDLLFTAKKCGRCGGSLDSGRIMSWFVDKTICMACSEKEDRVKQKMRSRGLDPNLYEGCGPLRYDELMDNFGDD